jgi:hypothetical protein
VTTTKPKAAAAAKIGAELSQQKRLNCRACCGVFLAGGPLLHTGK